MLPTQRENLSQEKTAPPVQVAHNGNRFAFTNDTQLVEALQATTGFDNETASRLLVTDIINTAANNDANGLLAMVHALNPQSPLEGLLTSHAVASHTMAMSAMRRAQTSDYLNQEEHCVKIATKLMNLFVKQTEALQKLKSGGTQQIVVQHVNVQAGGQAALAGVVNHG